MVAVFNLEGMKRQTSGKVYHIVSPKEGYYNSQVSRVSVATVYVEISADSTIEQ